MSAPRTMNPSSLEGLEVIDSEGNKIGKVDTIFLDVETDKPEWAAVKTGMFGGKSTLVPLVNADASGSELSVPYTKDTVKAAPHHDADQELSTDDEADLFRHYGVSFSGETATADEGRSSGQVRTDATAGRDEYAGQTAERGRGTVGHDTSGPNTDDAMTRSEERVHVGTEQVEAGRARLRKYIVTDTVSQTVPVSHEELRVEREPITEANRGAAMSGGELTEEEHEVVLHAERPVVAKETVPVERVRLSTETVTEQQEVSSEVRKERIEEVTGDATEGRQR